MSGNRRIQPITELLEAGEPLPGQGQMIAGQDIVCVSVMDWDWPFWTSRQNLMAQFSRRNRVLFVDPPPTFASDYYGAYRDPRLRKKLASWMVNRGFSTCLGNILVWTPPPSIPFNKVRNRALFNKLLAFNQYVFKTHLQRALDRIRFSRPILWISFNVYFGDAVIGKLGEKLSVYHCTDEITGFIGYSPYISEIEERLAARCDLVLTVSEVLNESKAAFNPNSHNIPNGADVELFSTALNWNGSEPADLLRLPAPRAGFIGHVEYRFDCDLVKAVAEAMPSWSFALIGPVQEPNKDINKLRNVPNVHFLGLKNRTLLPSYLAHLDVTLIPYKINQLTRGIFPLKLHEYLAAGRPVVATHIPSVNEIAGMVYLGKDAPSFARAIARAYEEDNADTRRKRCEAAFGHSWAKRAEEISDLLKRCLEAKGCTASVPAIERQLPSVIHDTNHLRGGSCQPAIWDDVRHRMETSEETDSAPGYRLPLRFFLRIGRELTFRHDEFAKQAVYRLFGDLNMHRRMRAAYVVATLLALGVNDGEILDVGCGEGACSLALAKLIRGCRVLGIDADGDSISACRKIARRLPFNSLLFEQADVRTLPYKERFDAVVCVDMLEHVDQDVTAMESIHRTLKTGGWLVLHVPMRHQWQRRILPGFKHGRVTGHVRDGYSQGEIVQKVVRAGFRVDKVYSTFGIPGELAFELNTLFSGVPGLRVVTAALTFPFALTLAYRELNSHERKEGNSFLVVARKPQRTLPDHQQLEVPVIRGNPWRSTS